MERIVPWFDRPAQARAHADVVATIRKSAATRAVAESVIEGRTAAMRGSYQRADDRLAGR